jgi:DNA-binding transcriptional ArsR family regulator
MARASNVSEERALDALGNPVRRQIVRLLGVAPRPVAALASELPVSRPAVSKHLRILQHADLVCFDRHGTQNVFRLSPGGFIAARRWLDGFWDEALVNFKRLAERGNPKRRRKSS